VGWTEIHNATQAAIVLASGLPSGKVLWKFQNANAPLQPYIAMKFTPSKTVGQDYKRYDLDLARPLGTEYKVSIAGTREVTLEIEAFTDSTADSSDALSLLEQVKSAFLLDGVMAALDAVELSVFDPGPVNYLPDVPTVNFRGRAVCSVRCYVPAIRAVEYAGYIATVTGKVTAISGGGLPPTDYPFKLPE